MIYLNILHRPGPGVELDVFKQQQDLVHNLGLKATVLLHYHDLFDDEIVDLAKSYQDEFGDEIALTLHKLHGPELEHLSGGLESIWLFSEKQKSDILAIVLEKYREVFGSHPTAVASYHFDSSSLRILKELAPDVQIVIGGCFEEGVRVFHGCNHSWYLFNEGMPWGPWYPAKTHSLRPARDAADAAGVVAVPHLCRDMTLSYEGRNDFWASHPPNVIRGMGNDASWCPYDRNLIDQYRLQQGMNRDAIYYNTFVGPSWLTWNHNSEYPPEVAWSLYRGQMDYFVELRDQGELTDMTMTEYGEWHNANRQYAESETYWAREILYGSKKHYFWYLDADLRVLIDTAQGGSIGDLRPYIGQVEVATGPDTPNREIASYPYLIQSQHRTGYPNHLYDGARTTLRVTRNGKTIDLATCRTRIEQAKRNGDEVVMRLSPAELKFSDGVELQVATTYRFQGNGKIVLERQLLGDYADPVELQEYFKGCHGRTEYAEDLHDIELAVDGATPQQRAFEYTGQEIQTADANAVRATVGALNTVVELAPQNGTAKSASARDGHLFSPYFTLCLTYTLQPEEMITTCLKLTAIN